MIDEDADAAAFFADKRDEIERPDDARWPIWSGYLQDAWREVRDDRHYGAWGGIGRIFFSTLNDYADRQGLEGAAFDGFLMFMRALDDEYVAFANAKQQAEMDKQTQS